MARNVEFTLDTVYDGDDASILHLSSIVDEDDNGRVAIWVGPDAYRDNTAEAYTSPTAHVALDELEEVIAAYKRAQDFVEE